MVDYSEEERAILRQGREFREMVETSGWKEYEKLLKAHIEAKRNELFAPIVTQGLEQQALDAATKFAIAEGVKGAVIALRLALEIPRVTIEQAQELVRASRGGSDGEADDS
jgi:hypothetical protein